jgi:tetratricopeptide (TPR) repeat protein
MVGVVSISFAGEYDDARLLLSAQKWAEALPILKALNEEEPESITIAQDLAQVFLRLNRREEALELLKKHKLNRPAEIAARTFLSKESFHFYQQGLDWLGKRAYSQACERFERALERDQTHIEILLRLSQCEILEGNADLALKNLEQLERIHGKTTESQAWRARAGALRGRNEEAIALLASLVTSKTSEPLTELIPLWWGEALLAAGKKSAALNVFEADLRRNPNHLQTGLAAIRIRLSQTESPNQVMSIQKDLAAWEALFEKHLKEKKKRGIDFVLEVFDAEAIQRSAADARQQLISLLPSPTPSPTARPASKH